MIKRLFLALMLSVSMLLTACSEKTQYKETKVFMLNYVHSYNNLGSLVENSEKIAVVRVMDEGTYEADTTSCEEMPELNVSPVVLTVHKVKVIKPLYNCEKGDVIEHIQMGGIYENVLYQEYNGSGFLEKGKEYLLFMIEDNGRYIEMNDAAGRCVIENEKVTSVHYDPEKEQTDVHGFYDVDLKEVIGKIKFIQSLPEPEKLAPGAEQHEYRTGGSEEEYSSWEELAEKSDVVCLVTVGKYRDGIREENVPVANCFDISVDQVFKGKIKEEPLFLATGNTLEYKETGVTEVEGVEDPWMFEGEQYLMFLERGRHGNGVYWCVGDAQGRFAVHDGKITAMKYLYPDRVKKGLDVKEMQL